MIDMKRIYDLDGFMNSIFREEFYDNPRSFIKGIKVTLLYLGFDPEWVCDDLTNYLWEVYNESK